MIQANNENYRILFFKKKKEGKKKALKHELFFNKVFSQWTYSHILSPY